VMKWGFILVTLYTGPLGLLIYVLADKEPRPGTHDYFTDQLWPHPLDFLGNLGRIFDAEHPYRTSAPQLWPRGEPVYDSSHKSSSDLRES
jgi:hypothetical protein